MFTLFLSSKFTGKSCIFPVQTEISEKLPKARLLEGANLHFPLYNHGENAAHHSSHCNNGRFFLSKGSRKLSSVAKGQNTGKINSHKIVFLCSKISSRSQLVIGRLRLRLSNSSKNFFLGLGVNPYSFFFCANLRTLGSNKAINILSFSSRVSTDIDGFQVLPL